MTAPRPNVSQLRTPRPQPGVRSTLANVATAVEPGHDGTVELDEVERTIPMPDAATDQVPDDSTVLPEGYAVGALLGRGGEGEVHVAVQRVFQRPVAIKSVRKGAITPGLLRRFRAEAVVTALLEHPNIIPIYDLRPGEGGQLQLVMKKVGGHTWRQLLAGEPPASGREPLGADDHLDILLKVCDAVAFAHERGILHRDLKPENVMVGAHGEVLVMDWGCAAHLGPRSPHPFIPTLTDLVSVSGTPSYMPPEMARAEHARCGPHTDVYLLGGILYLMLTGSPPHRRDTVSEAMRAAMLGHVDDPSGKAGRKIPSEMTRICLDALAADPAQRFATVDAFADALRRFRSHREVHRLLADARAQLETARAGGQGADDAFRRAISATEQAVHLWPELATARRLFVEVGLASARHALSAGSFRLARRQAQSAREAATLLGDGKATDAAERIAEEAQRRETAARTREATLAATRRVALGAGAVAGMALIVGMLLAWRASQRSAEALQKAHQNLAMFEDERTARVEREHLAGPALLAQARELAAQRRFAESLPLLDAAEGFCANDPTPALLRGQHLAVLGRHAEAADALDRYLARRSDDDAVQLRDLCRHPPNDIDARIAEILVRQGHSAAAASLNLAVDAREKLLRDQLATAWPNLGQRSLVRQGDGTFALLLNRPANEPVVSLDPLRGMPLSILNLGGQERIRDLTPLAGMPLVQLVITGAGVRDLAPLAGMRLKRFEAQAFQGQLDVLRGMPLEALDLAGVIVPDLALVAGMPLKELRLGGNDAIGDLTPLAALPLEVLALDASPKGGQINDLAPLRGRPLRELSLGHQRNLSSIAPLAGCPLQRCDLNSTQVSDLAPLAKAPVRRLNITDSQVTDLRPILKTPLELLDVSPQRIAKGLPELRAIPSLTQINGMQRDDFFRFLDVHKAAAAGNPAYAWDGRGTFDNGRLVSADFVGLRSVAFLKSQPLTALRLVNCDLTDIGALAGLSGLHTLLLQTQNTVDLSPLTRLPLESLELSQLRQPDLAPLAQLTRLRRLSLLQVKVADLSPILRLPLSEFAFTPGGIPNAALETLRGMPTLLRIGVGDHRPMPAAQFWRAFDAGEIKKR